MKKKRRITDDTQTFNNSEDEKKIRLDLNSEDKGRSARRGDTHVKGIQREKQIKSDSSVQSISEGNIG